MTLLKFKVNIRMGKEGDLNDFKHGIAFQKMSIYWEFSHNPFLGFTENGLKKTRYAVSVSSLGEKWLVGVKSQSKIARLLTGSSSEQTTLEAVGLQQQKSTLL